LLPFIEAGTFAYNAALGECKISYYPWIYNEDLGWAVPFSANQEVEAFFFWKPEVEWLYTQEDWFPFLWSYKHEKWIWIDAGLSRTHQWYINQTGEEWVEFEVY